MSLPSRLPYSTINVTFPLAATLCLLALQSACRPALSLPPTLEALAVEHAEATFTQTSLEELMLDRVEEVVIRKVRHPLPLAGPSPHEADATMWCFTTKARGTLAGKPKQVTAEWIAFDRPEGESSLILRHYTAYLAIWDDMCDGTDTRGR